MKKEFWHIEFNSLLFSDAELQKHIAYISRYLKHMQNIWVKNNSKWGHKA